MKLSSEMRQRRQKLRAAFSGLVVDESLPRHVSVIRKEPTGRPSARFKANDLLRQELLYRPTPSFLRKLKEFVGDGGARSLAAATADLINSVSNMDEGEMAHITGVMVQLNKTGVWSRIAAQKELARVMKRNMEKRLQQAVADGLDAAVWDQVSKYRGQRTVNVRLKRAHDGRLEEIGGKHRSVRLLAHKIG